MSTPASATAPRGLWPRSLLGRNLLLMAVLIVLGAACVGILVEAFLPKRARRLVQLVLSFGSLGAAVIAVATQAGRNLTTAADAVAIDSAGLFLQGTIAVLGLLGLLLVAERKLAEPLRTESFPLALFALGGMMLFVSANDLLVMFVALEVLSLPLYLLCGMARQRRLLAQESAVKYFLLGAFASAFFLYGVALLYGYAGTVKLAGIREVIENGPDDALGGQGGETLLLLGLALLLVGLLFKAGAVPFHSWTPDVYQGAPTPITALMAACTKVAAFGAIARVLYVCFGGIPDDWRPLLTGVAIATMLLGAIFAVTQTDIKRLLAYSSVANAGFILTGTVALSKDGLAGTLFFLAAYGATIIGALGVVTLVRAADGEANHLSRWAGLGRRSPWSAGAMTFFMLSFAGIPLTAGFTSKFSVFSAAYDAGSPALVIVGVIASMIIAFPYLRLVVLMYTADSPSDAAAVQLPGFSTRVAITVGVLATLALGVAPQVLLELATDAARFVA